MKDLKLQAVKVAASFTFSPMMLIVGLLCITYITYRHRPAQRKCPEHSRCSLKVDEDELQKGLQEKTGRKKKDEQNRRLLSVYLQLKPELEQQIRKLRALADRIDNVHRDCTITQVVAKSTSAVSGVLTILGHALAPVTAGVSLGLSATGLGLGAAAAVTSVSTSLVEKISTELAESEASHQVPTSQDKGEVIKKVLEKNTPEFASVFKSSFKKLKDMKTSIDTINLAKSRQAIEGVSLGNTRQVEKSFKGTALAMTKGERIKDATTAGLYLVLDVVSLIQESKHLHEGAKTESAAELRQKAQDLEQRLQELIQVIDSLT